MNLGNSIRHGDYVRVVRGMPAASVNFRPTLHLPIPAAGDATDYLNRRSQFSSARELRAARAVEGRTPLRCGRTKILLRLPSTLSTQ
jgi:hypothetical protein